MIYNFQNIEKKNKKQTWVTLNFRLSKCLSKQQLLFAPTDGFEAWDEGPSVK